MMTYEDKMAARLSEEMTKLIGNAGKVLGVQAYEPAKGGGWAVIVDSEYAALKIHYRYRHSNVNVDKIPAGYAVCLRAK